MDEKNADYVAIVLINDGNPEEFFMVPTKIVNETLQKANEAWLTHPKRDGSPRKKTSHRALDFNGEYSKFAPHRGMRKRWEIYNNNWDFL